MNTYYFPPNQRSHHRSQVSKDASVIFPDERRATDVIIKDLSVGGARIQLRSSTDLSGEFNIFIPTDKVLHTAAVRWMRGDLAGLQFETEPVEVGLKNDTPRKI
jgi:hypothetical protein